MKLSINLYIDNRTIVERVFNSINQDLNKEKEKLRLKEKEIIYTIEDENFSHILAATSSFLKLINEALKLEDLLKERTLKQL